MKQYFALLPEYLARCANRVGLWVTILAGVVFFVVASAFGLDRVTVPVTMAIILLGALEASYSAYREERIMRAERDAKVRLSARPVLMSWNHPDADPEKTSVGLRVEWEIWTDIDIKTSEICLNIIEIRRRERWPIWGLSQPTRKALEGLRPKGQDTYQYRKSIRESDTQPFQDSGEFEYEGLRDDDRTLGFELVLKTGSPFGTYRADVDFRPWDRDSRKPL